MKISILSCFEDLMHKDTGAFVRIYHLAKNISSRGYEVQIIIPGVRATFEWTKGVVISSVGGLCPTKVLKLFSNLLGVQRPTPLLFYDFLFILRISSLVAKSDLIQIEQPWASGLVIPFLAKISRKPLVVDCHDAFQSLKVKRRLLRTLLELFVEKIVYKYADKIIVVSKDEEKLLLKNGISKDKIVVIPNGVDTETFTPKGNTDYIENYYKLKGYYKVIFVGNMEYLPNQEAVQIIVKKIAPIVRSKIGNVKFIVVGRLAQKFDSPDVLFTGVVENVAEYLAASDAAIVPLFHGSGTRLKILEFFSCGLPVVSTRTGVEGLEVKNGENVLIEDDVNEFAAKVIELLGNRAFSMKLGQAARELVINKYDWRKVGEQLNRVYNSLLTDRE